MRRQSGYSYNCQNKERFTLCVEYFSLFHSYRDMCFIFILFFFNIPYFAHDEEVQNNQRSNSCVIGPPSRINTPSRSTPKSFFFLESSYCILSGELLPFSIHRGEEAKLACYSGCTFLKNSFFFILYFFHFLTTN